MFMPYIEGPKMDWTVNDGLYHRFLKWYLKFENILECELAMLPERRQCKKVIAWSGDFGIDQYLSWSFSNEELMLDTIWEKFEEFCKPQSNEARARFDLTSFQQGNKSVKEWYNAVQTQVALANYPPPKTAKILHRDIFWFFLKDEEFVSKTINDSNIDLDKFTVSKVRQVVKKMESSKVTTRHIKQVMGDPQALQINLMHHHHTDLPASKHKKEKSFVKPRPPSHKNDNKYLHTTTVITRKALMQRMFTRTRRDARNEEILYIMKVSSVQQRNISASLATSMGTLQVYVFKRNKFLLGLGNQRPICCKWEMYMLETSPYAATQKICLLVMSLFTCKS